MADPKKHVDMSNLSPELKQIVTDKKISGQKKIKEWMRLLREVAAYDELTDELLVKTKKRHTRLIILTVVSILLTFFTIPLFPLPILFVIALIVFIVMMVKTGGRKKELIRHDLANDFRTLLVPFLQVLSDDINPKGRIYMELDFAGPSQEKVTQTGPIPPGRFKKVIETVYKDPWLHLNAPLLDGSRLSLDIETTYVSQDRHWRNPRGKNKHKQKWKKIPVVSAGLKVDAERAGFDTSQAPDGPEKLKFSAKDAGDVARISRKFKFKSISAPPADNASVDDLVQMLFYLSSRIKPSMHKVAS